MIANYLYWSTYIQLEKDIQELTYFIHFCDKTHAVFSNRIVDLLIQCATNIESLAKALFEREGGDMNPKDDSGNERHLLYDLDCLKLLDMNWRLGKKQVDLVSTSMHFQKPELKTLMPLKNAHKGEAPWQIAYQAVKHNRMKDLSRGTIENLLKALAALYILNIYYRDEEYEVGSFINQATHSVLYKNVFDKTMQSSIFSVSYVAITGDLLNTPELNDYSNNIYVECFDSQHYKHPKQSMVLSNLFNLPTFKIRLMEEINKNIEIFNSEDDKGKFTMKIINKLIRENEQFKQAQENSIHDIGRQIAVSNRIVTLNKHQNLCE